MTSSSACRVRRVGSREEPAEGRFVLYWMTANRRLAFNHALDRALEWCEELGQPLVVFEPLRVDYPYPSVRFHRFVIEGMVEHAHECEKAGVAYVPCVEQEAGRATPIFDALLAEASVVVTDDHPLMFYPAMIERAAERWEGRLEAVDAWGLLPFRENERAFARAVDFRRHLQKVLPRFLAEGPSPQPLSAVSAEPADWPDKKTLRELRETRPPATWLEAGGLEGLPIDGEVGALELCGGGGPARRRLEAFLEDDLDEYDDRRRDLDRPSTSGLSPYLHFGHLGAWEAFAAVAEREDWNPSRLGDRARGQREGWWGMSAPAESFLDELVTWRELGLNGAAHMEAYTEYEGVPEWARQTLADHREDERPDLYSLEELEEARTGDEIWNAAQRQLRGEGLIHNYLRMLWGKKILEWSPDPREAAERMVYLNDKYAIDGRDPNSYSGIYWVLGRYDRAWGPERPIFGKVRYMSSDSARRKLRMQGYLDRWGPD